jgi:hypothetical protein
MLASDELGECDHVRLGEMASQLGKHRVRYAARGVRVAGQRSREGEGGPLAVGEERTRSEVSERREFARGEERLALPVAAVRDAPAASREFGRQLPHEQPEPGLELDRVADGAAQRRVRG